MHFLPLKSTTRDDAVYCYWAKHHHASKSHRIYSTIYLSALLNSCHHQTKPDTDEEQAQTTRRPRKVCLVERENFISLISPRHPSSRRYDTLSPTKPRPDHHNNIHIRRLTRRRWSPRVEKRPKYDMFGLNAEISENRCNHNRFLFISFHSQLATFPVPPWISPGLNIGGRHQCSCTGQMQGDHWRHYWFCLRNSSPPICFHYRLIDWTRVI